MRHLLWIVWAAAAWGGAVERAGYDSRGHLIAVLSPEGELEAISDFVAVLPNGKRVSLKDRRDAVHRAARASRKSGEGLSAFQTATGSS